MAEKNLIIDFWDVGQGDGSVVRLPDGKLVIIDIGPRNTPIIDWLADASYTIHAVAISHNDNDHAGGLPSLVKLPNVSFGRVYMLEDRDPKSETFLKLWKPVREAEKMGRLETARLTAETVIWQDNNLSIKVVYPNFAENIESNSSNQTSGVVCLYYKDELKIVWPGDAPMKVVGEKCRDTAPFLLSGPHHGGPIDRNASDFKNSVESFVPERVFISVGTKNQHSHPSPRYLKMHVQRGCVLNCSQLTKLCDNNYVNNQTPVIKTAALLGLRPAHTGVPCRGCLRIAVAADGSLTTDPWDAEHQKRVKLLKRAKCL